MRANFLRLDENRILVEQLYLNLRNERSTLIPDVALPVALLWILSNESNAFGLRIWLVSVITMKLALFFVARHFLSAGITEARARKLTWLVVLMQAMFGAAWGAFAWAALDPGDVMSSLLVLAVLAGVVGSVVAQISSILPVLMAFSTAMLLAMVSRMWTLNDHTYDVLGILSILYVAYMFLHAVNSYRTVRSVIELRFENSELIGQLRIETGIAAAAQLEAEQANTAKSKFLAAASHDLRQPIHAQGLFLEVLSRTELNGYQRELVSSSRAAAEASSELLNALLDFSRIEAGVIEPCLQAFRLQPLLHKIENELAPQADAKNIVYRSRETQAVVRTDPVLLELILRNLVTNAIRYTERGGVLVGCRKQGAHIVLGVWDTGIGIAPEHQKEVFREFHQLGNPERDRNKGLGLGLAIAEGLARTLGHGLALASIPQQGSAFRLTLPVDNSIQLAQITMTQSRTRMLNARLLVVDDDKIVRDSMLHLLRDWGCECEAAESIEEALALARITAPDLVISDYRLREQRTGVEAIAALRALLGESLPALLITGDTAPERLREAQASGIPLLHKPVSPGKLYRRLVELQQETV
ncbi:MAG: ATP-binding protein [Sideroxyarcus sp.]|nr:ATP-binding protein [Sideroxyarcus sp.]